MLDRERADFFRTLESLKSAFGPHVVATEIPIGTEHEVRGVIDLIDMKAYEYPSAERGACREIPIPDDLQAQAEEYREKLMDEVAEVSESLMERYLEGEEISHDEIVTALKDGTNHGDLFPVVCGVATKNLGTNRLLDAIVEDLPSTGQARRARAAGDHARARPPTRSVFAYVFKTRADPFAGRINLFRVYQGVDEARHAGAQHPHARQGAHRPAAHLRGQGDRARRRVRPRRHRRGGQAQGDARGRLAGRARRADLDAVDQAARRRSWPSPSRRAKGDEDKVFPALRRLQEEDPTIDLHRDPQTGEQIVAGLSQIHVEVIVDRLKSRFGVEVDLKPPRVPYQETIRKPAKAHGRHKKQTGGRGQFGDCHIEIEPLAGDEFEFVDKIKGGVIPTGFIPAVEKGVQDAMAPAARSPATRSRACA